MDDLTSRAIEKLYSVAKKFEGNPHGNFERDGRHYVDIEFPTLVRAAKFSASNNNPFLCDLRDVDKKGKTPSLWEPAVVTIQIVFDGIDDIIEGWLNT